MTERQTCCEPTYGRDCMLVPFGVLLGYMRGQRSLRLLQETALSLLKHWSVCERVCVCLILSERKCLPMCGYVTAYWGNCRFKKKLRRARKGGNIQREF